MRAAGLALAVLLLAALGSRAPAQVLHGNLPYLKKRAQRLMDQLDFRGAERFLRQAAERFSEDAELLLLRGDALFSLGRWEAAAASYRRGLEISAELLPRVANYPLCLVNLGRLDEAWRVCGQVLERAESDRERMQGEFGRALVLIHRGETDEALKHLELAYELDPGAPKVSFRLGLLLRAAGRLEEAARHLERVVERHGLHEAAIHNLALIAMQRGDRAAAERWRERHLDARRAHGEIGRLRTRLSGKPGDTGALARIADLCFEGGAWEDALGPYVAVIAAHPREARPRFRYATSLLRLGRCHRARIQLEVLLKHTPGHAGARAMLESIRKTFGLKGR